MLLSGNFGSSSFRISNQSAKAFDVAINGSMSEMLSEFATFTALAAFA